MDSENGSPGAAWFRPGGQAEGNKTMGHGRQLGTWATAVVTATMMVVAATAAALLPTAGPAAAQSDASTDQRVVSLVGNYNIRPDGGVVDVTEQITVRNVKGSQQSGNTITSFFWTGHEIWAPEDAENLSISVDGEELEWEIFDTVSGVLLIDAFYRRNLNFGQTRVIDVTYTLPTYPPGEGVRRLNSALFDLELLVCCNYEEVDLTVTVPNTFVVFPPTSLDFTAQPGGTEQVFTYTDDEVTGEFTEILFTEWFGFDEAGLERSTAAVGDNSIEIIYPPDDAGWGADTTANVEAVGTELVRLTGSELPIDDLSFDQGRDDTFDPLSGIFVFDEPIFVPRDASDQDVAVLMGQAWLDDTGITDDRIRNGLAAALGVAALEATGDTVDEPLDPAGANVNTDRASFWVMRQIGSDIGPEGLGQIVQQMEADELAYTAEGVEAETTATITNDWRRFLDLAEERNGSGRAAELLEDHVLTADEAAQLEQRATSRTRFAELAARADGVMPLGVRTAMTNWDFDEADTLMTITADVLDERERIIGDDTALAADEQLALGDNWVNAGTEADLQALEAQLLDRESELRRASLMQWGLILGGLAVLIGAAALGFVLWRRRTATPAAAAGPFVAGEVSQAPAGPEFISPHDSGLATPNVSPDLVATQAAVVPPVGSPPVSAPPGLDGATVVAPPSMPSAGQGTSERSDADPSDPPASTPAGLAGETVVVPPPGPVGGQVGGSGSAATPAMPESGGPGETPTPPDAAQETVVAPSPESGYDGAMAPPSDPRTAADKS